MEETLLATREKLIGEVESITAEYKHKATAVRKMGLQCLEIACNAISAYKKLSVRYVDDDINIEKARIEFDALKPRLDILRRQ